MSSGTKNRNKQETFKSDFAAPGTASSRRTKDHGKEFPGHAKNVDSLSRGGGCEKWREGGDVPSKGELLACSTSEGINKRKEESDDGDWRKTPEKKDEDEEGERRRVARGIYRERERGKGGNDQRHDHARDILSLEEHPWFLDDLTMPGRSEPD
ncbi:hypothetical protein BHE74_00032407 [Ensete ventricosum]|nr:hypothetical protein BHE74_00032407 [Ensete ventricosum]